VITPPALRAVSHADAPLPEPTPDMRTWSGRNAKAIGTIIGTALSVFLVGTGGLTGLAHVAGIALTKDLEPIHEKIAGVERNQQAAAKVDAERSDAVNKKLDAIAKDAKAARAAVQSRTKKPKVAEPAGGNGE